MQRRSRRDRLHLWRDAQWFLIGALWVLALVLGYSGFARNAAARGLARSAGDLVYLTLQLLSFGSGMVEGPVGWQLEIARFLLPTLAAYTALRALAALFREQVQLLYLRFLRRHVVICGLGRKGFLLTAAFRARGNRVVVIEKNDDNDLLGQCRDRGAVVLAGDAADPELLRRAAVQRAGRLIAVCDRDGTNAEIAVRAQELNRGRRRGTLNCVIHIVDPQLRNLLRARQIGAGGSGTFRLDILNVFDQGARLLLAQHPPFAEGSAVPRLLVIGLGRLGENLVVHAAREWRERKQPAGRLRITAIDLEAVQKCASIEVRYPQLAAVCELVPLQMDLRSPEFLRGEFLFDSGGRCSLDRIYVCLDDDSLGLHVGLTLLQRLGAHPVPIVVRMAEEAGLATLMRGQVAGGDSFASLSAFGLLDRTCTPELLLGGTHEILARALHEEYVRRQQEQGETWETNPVLRPWDQLPERLRESNRRQVDHIGAKLRSVGCTIEPLSDWDAAAFAFTAEEVEGMARLEHERWCAEQEREGWHYAAGAKDPRRRTNPALVPWDELPEEERKKNRNAVRELPTFLARAGFQVERR